MGTYRRVQTGEGKSVLKQVEEPKTHIPMGQFVELQAQRDVLQKEVDRLSAFVTDNFGDEIGGDETAVDVAIRLMSKKTKKPAKQETTNLDTSDHR